MLVMSAVLGLDAGPECRFWVPFFRYAEKIGPSFLRMETFCDGNDQNVSSITILADVDIISSSIPNR